MITITGGPGKSRIVEHILTEDTLFINMDPSAKYAFSHAPCPVFEPVRMRNAYETAMLLGSDLNTMAEGKSQILFYSNLCMEHIAPFRDVLQEYERKTGTPVILVYKGNHSAYPLVSEPLSKRERVLADALMGESYKSLNELIHLFWEEKYGSEGDVIRVMISNLRRKGFKVECLKGIGYRWTSK